MDKGVSVVVAGGRAAARLDVTEGHSTQSLADKSGGLSTAQVPSKRDFLGKSVQSRRSPVTCVVINILFVL